MTRLPQYQRRALIDGGKLLYSMVTNLTGFKTHVPTGLSESRSPEEKDAIVDKFFKLYEDLVAKHPEDHGMDYVHAYIVIAKNWPTSVIWFRLQITEALSLDKFICSTAYFCREVVCFQLVGTKRK